MANKSLSPIRSYFNDCASRFDSYYHHEADFLKGFIDGNFRKSITLRYRWTLNILGKTAVGKNILDAGCGSGQYCIALAKAGAKRVVGVDLSPGMLELARRNAKAAGVADRCDFLLGDFLTADCTGPFDFALAFGFFEYLKNPDAHLRKLASLTSREIFASFPVRLHWLTPQRKLRYLFHGIPVHFYTEKEILGILSEAGLTAFHLERLDRDFVLSAVHAR